VRARRGQPAQQTRAKRDEEEEEEEEKEEGQPRARREPHRLSWRPAGSRELAGCSRRPGPRGREASRRARWRGVRGPARAPPRGAAPRGRPLRWAALPRRAAGTSTAVAPPMPRRGDGRPQLPRRRGALQRRRSKDRACP
ncbi:unnamed protein product, partial [Prorocentrum cordatum]